MVKFRHTLPPLAMLLAMLVIVAACTDKANPTGNNWSNVLPITVEDSLSFDMGFSYPVNSLVSGSETNLLCGNFEGVETVMAAHFTALPDSFMVPAAYADSCYLQLTLVRRSPAIRFPVLLSVYKLDQYWKEDAAGSIQDANMTLITQNFSVPDTILASGTDIQIPLPPAFLNTLNGADQDSLSLVVKCQPEGYAEIRSRSTGRGPLLRFVYKAIDSDGEVDTDDTEYEVRTVRDSYRIDSDVSSLLENQWVLRNISPSRMFVRWVDNWNLFRDNAGNILDEARRKKVTINRAELVFSAKENPYYGASTNYSLRGDRWDGMELTTALELPDGNQSTGLTTSAFISGDSVVVKITPVMQAFVNGDKPNRGVVVLSTQELNNYGMLELWHFLNAPAGKKPRLRITYTPPFL
jgi:hypothetical protein